MHARQAHRGLARLTTLALGAGLLVSGAGLGAGASGARADDPATPFAGALTSGDSLFPRQGNGGYDALHYDVDLAVDVAVSPVPNAVAATSFPAATSSMRAQTTGAPLSSYGMDFQGTGLTVSAVTVDGVPATYERTEVLTVDDATTDVHKLVVTPATPVSGVFTTVVTYAGTPHAHTDTDGSAEGWNNTRDGATFVNEPVGAMTAYPHNNTPADKATYTVTLDVPTRLGTSATVNPGVRDAAAVSNGELVSRTPSADGTRATWVWDQREQMASDLVLISLGRYDVLTSEITLASGRTIPEGSFLDPSMSPPTPPTR